MLARWQDLAARRVAILDEVARIVPAEGGAVLAMPVIDETDGSHRRKWAAATHRLTGMLISHPPLVDDKERNLCFKGYERILSVNLGSDEYPHWWMRRLRMSHSWLAYPAATEELTRYLESLGYQGTVALFVETPCLEACVSISSVLELETFAAMVQ